MPIRFKSIYPLPKTALIAFIFIVIAACEKADYNTILRTDEDGNVLGGDQTDWEPRCHGIVPADFYCVTQAFPNPATDQVNFIVSLREEGYVSLQIHKNQFIVIRNFTENQKLPAGDHWFSWDLRNDDGKRVKDDFYRVKIKVEDMDGYGWETFGDVEVR